MLTKDQVIEQISEGKTFTLDARDYARLCKFMSISEIETMEQYVSYRLNLKEDYLPEKWTEDNILFQLQDDLSFAFEKALDKRGISASIMNDVVKMWLWILEDDLQYDEEYEYYGLPLLKKVALKYNFDNPIGDNEGNEEEYRED